MSRVGTSSSALAARAYARVIDRVVRGRFSALTVLVVSFSLSGDLIENESLRRLVLAIVFTGLLVFALRIVGPWLRRALVVVALPSFLAHWALRFGGPAVPQWLAFSSATTVLTVLTFVVLFEVLTDESITIDTIVGALCAYFLLGVAWGAAYATLEALSPGSLSVSPALAKAAGWQQPTMPITPLLQYYSLTTLATLGLGDVSPLSPAARILTALEGMTGQLYLAVLIARLVSIHTSSRLADR